MYFISILIVLALMQYRRDSFSVIQRDGWFYRLLQLVARKTDGNDYSVIFTVLLPCILLALLLFLTGKWLWGLAELLICIVILVYSIGRGEYIGRFEDYIEAWQTGQTARIPSILQALDKHYVPHMGDDAPDMHVAARRVFVYSAFTRLFVVLFWFSFLGPVAALLYRLLRLHYDHDKNAMAHLLITVMEWPVVRVFGISVALLGNFSAAFSIWLATLLDVGLSASKVIHQITLAALNQDLHWQDKNRVYLSHVDDRASMAIQEIADIRQLLKRCLVFAVVVIAFLHILV